MRHPGYILYVITITLAMFCPTAAHTQAVKEYKAKKDENTQRWGYENKGDKEHWWQQAHSQGKDQELMNCNREIQWLIAPQYSNAAKEFEESLAGVEINGKVGFIDKNNRFVIAPQFEPVKKLKGFSHGLAAVKKDGKYGYIDKTGIFIIHPIFDYAENFEDNHLATVKMGSKYGAIDLKGDTVVPCKFIAEEAMKNVPFSNKQFRQAVKDTKNRYEDGYYDNVTQLIQEAEVIANRSIRNQAWRPINERKLIIASKESSKGLKYSLSDTAWVVPPHFSSITPLDSKGEFYAVTMTSGTGVYDCYGRQLLSCIYETISPQEQEQIFVVYTTKSNAGLCSYSGSLIVPTSFESISSFSNGEATASLGGVSTTIDVNGQVPDHFINQILPLGLDKQGVDFKLYYRRIANIRPTCAQAHNNLGIYALEIQENKEGMNYLKIANKLDPNDKQIAANLKQAKSDRNDRRWKRIENALEIAGAVIGIATTTYATTQGVSIDPSSYTTVGSSSSYSSSEYDNYSSSASASSKSTKSSTTKPQKNPCGEAWRTAKKAYDGYDDQLAKMNCFPEKYDASQYKNIQREMRSIRQKWEGKGCQFTKSPRE